MNQTDVLALWGAVTGTIGTFAGLFGLWLRFRQHGLDKPKLKCESTFGFDSPNYPKHYLTIRSTGRRPVSIDKIQYFILPRDWKQKITKYWQHKAGKWLWNQEPKSNIKLNEGEKENVSIILPEGICISEIYKVEVVDQTGKHWPVKWQSKTKLKRVATQEILSEFNEENNKRLVCATGYRVGQKYFLETKFNTKPSRSGKPCGRSFWFLEFSKYEEKLREVTEIQADQFLAGEIEEIQ